MPTEVVLRGEKLIEHLDSQLAEYAVKHRYGIGARLYEEEWDPNDSRTPFQHDRDRIIHSRAFRRLRGKTQVFPPSRGDHYRTRLSHSLEVAQLSRSVARVLRLNEDLAEAIALGHDLGHPSFGHAAEEELNDILRGKTELWPCDIGGFKHNVNSLKVVDFFERYRAQFPGLNLTHWTREGILKHTDLTDRSGLQVHDPVLDLGQLRLEVGVPSFLEGQIVAVCDELAQVTHDVEDAVRADLIEHFDAEDSDWCQVDVYREALRRARRSSPLDKSNLRTELIRNLIRLLIDDLISATEQRIRKCVLGQGSANPADRPFNSKIVNFSTDVMKQVETLQRWLKEVLCRSYDVSRADTKARLYIRCLFKAYHEKPERMPDYVYRKYEDARKTPPNERLNRKNLEERAATLKKDPIFVRSIAEHIAGMTDQYLMNEYRQLFAPDMW